MQNAKLLIATLVLTLLFVFGFSWVAQNWLQPTGDSPYNISASPEELLTATPHTYGAGEDAQFTIVEFSDFLCPACAATGPALKALIDQYPNQVRLVYRHFPLTSIHPTASLLAEISEVSASQGKFWNMHDFIFVHQSELSEMSAEETIAFFQARSEDLGLTQEDWPALIEAGTYESAVEEDLRRAEMLGLSFTPSIFLNGELMPIDQVESTIREALKP